ncbi:galactose-1-phosphate uridylyltransferase [Spiractinospora alimapuensis]|uniref:galactose-1-phosphate uridylyltransferase n=1 Tax=Spiractinospora alimapuensis TaxID=2820884 RepID=UPI001F2172DC|nr:galactose-1-phosphate uridylyltransferase [Spiractinospora alimapuensis]QVQ49979.1 galactose-1-phosphate uridylyltransferase [Spiractinospora alimapuensis]
MRKTTGTLADGREILYYDETAPSGGRPGEAGARAEPAVPVDRRAAEDRPTAPEMRFDPLRREWVVIAAHRQERTHLPPSDSCPLCPSSADNQSEIPASTYDVVCFENRFPALMAAPDTSLPDVGELVSSRGHARGRCEVVCFTPDHDASVADLPERRIRTIVDVLADRTQALAASPAVEEVFCFENRGPEIGVTLHHPHGQIYGYPFVTPRTTRALDSATEYQDRTGRNLYADNLHAERLAGLRVVRTTEHWTAFVPAAARWPVEVHLYPHRRVPDLPALTDAERDDFSVLYRSVLRAMDRLFDLPMPYVSAWHQAPVRTKRDLAYLHLELLSVRRAPGKLKYLAGSEAAMGVFVNDVPPETIATRLREALS